MPEMFGPIARNTTRSKAKVLRRLDGVTERAVDTIIGLLDDPNPVIRLAAAKEILDRRFGRPRAAVDVRAAHVDLGAAHLDALRTLAERGVRTASPEPATQ
jgi:HEAT repeat protein